LEKEQKERKKIERMKEDRVFILQDIRRRRGNNKETVSIT